MQDAVDRRLERFVLTGSSAAARRREPALRAHRVATSPTAVRFWRDPDGPEVDWIVERRDRWVPVETKWTDAPRPADARHVETFLAEYDEADHGFVVCRTPRRLKLTSCPRRRASNLAGSEQTPAWIPPARA